MIEWVAGFSPAVQALLGTGFTWAMTAVGAATIFVGRALNQKILDWMLGFAAGVMIAASYWSLLAPALELSEGGSLPVWLPAVVGFLLGGLFLRGLDLVLPHLHLTAPRVEQEGMQVTWKRTTLLILAITLHNIPEGLAIGVAFGAAASKLATGVPAASVAGAVALAIGIGIQNFPEAMAVSMPLYRAGMSKSRSFWYGQLSGVVEPVAGVLGAIAVSVSRVVLPYALAFAAGAMIFVVVEDLVPEAQCEGNTDLATMGAMIGFAVMMTLDVALG